ncbi:MAG: flagellar basal body-associated FliL family protein [Geobacteraceae bacterium]|nr:flagellar basal body-associated FliL family protein [Geobacteraceae bacterium]
MAKEEQAAAEAPAEGGSKKKLFIIIGAAVLVLVIAGVVVFMMMGKGDKKKEGADAHGAPAADGGHGAAPPAAGGGHGAAGAAAGVSTVFTLEPFIVNIYDGQELRYLKVKVELEMSNAAVKPELEGRLAAIRDAILVVLTTKTLQEIQDAQGKNQLREEILTAISKIVAQGKVSKVYFTDFVVQ